MTDPIDIKCPACASTAGSYCTSVTHLALRPPRVMFHAERINAAHSRDDPRALREALRAAIGRLETRQDLGSGDLSFILTVRETFDL